MTAKGPDAPRDPFFLAKRFTGTFQVCGRTLALDLHTPDLRALPTHTWGDWGPMHTCSVSIDRITTVSYRCPETGRSATYRLCPPTISLCSPPLVEERARTPLYVEIDDTARGLRLRGYLDRDGEPSKIEVVRLVAGLDVTRTVFREAEAARELVQAEG